MKQFFKYFKNKWLVQHVGWYEGYLEKAPLQTMGKSHYYKNHSVKKQKEH
jgi:hypothetical protein